ncbi:hypothetical protein BD414DRAFT_567210 [Trametes punicea]|nr:hypothetical protein BD414DRAFT_567210 [Trametes punicea]
MPYSSDRSPTAGSSKLVAKKLIAGRKCYRVSKNNNEVVWPPPLEEALIEGLDKYEPAVSKSPRGLTRFPNRNKFIADYILRKTGQIRTAKQVGSRIQQLRDTAAGKHIMKAYSDRHYEMMHPPRRTPSEQQDALGLSVPAVTVPGDRASAFVPSVPPVVQVYISVPPASASPSNTATWPASTSQPSLPQYTNVNVPHNGLYEFVEPRSLHTIDPTVTFMSTSPANLFSRFTVFCGNNVVYVDPPVKMAIRASDEPGVGGYFHYTKLTPGYWDALCGCNDLSPYTILQEITKEVTDPDQRTATVLRVQYQFIQSSSGQSRPLSPFMLNAEVRPFDYDADSGSDIFPFFPAEALSTGSESPLPSDRSSSPSYTIPPGFISQPISPAGWNPQTQVPWQGSFAGSASQPQQYPTSTFYDMQQQQQHSMLSFAHISRQQDSHLQQQPSVPGPYYGPTPS